jgi:hypothetical protein
MAALLRIEMVLFYYCDLVFRGRERATNAYRARLHGLRYRR